MQVFSKDTSKWNIIRSKQGQEKKVSLHLSRKNILNFCPYFLPTQDNFTSRKPISSPLFPACIFVNLRSDQTSKVLKIRGVEGYLFSLGKRTSIPDEIIQLLEHIVQETKILQVHRLPVDFFSKENVLVKTENYHHSVVPSTNPPIKVTLPTLGITLLFQQESYKTKSPFYSLLKLKEQQL